MQLFVIRDLAAAPTVAERIAVLSIGVSDETRRALSDPWHPHTQALVSVRMRLQTGQ